MEPITYDELIAEINRLDNTSTTIAKAHTLKEFAELWDKKETAVRKMLREADKLGILRQCKKKIKCIDGRDYTAPAYYFEIKIKEARKRKKSK